MASLHFIYATMNSGKSSELLQIAHNYTNTNKKVSLLKPRIDTFSGDTIESRLGISKKCVLLDDTNYILEISKCKTDDCVLVDEAQFLTKPMVTQLAYLVDKYNIPVLCFGLRTDYMGNLFTGTKALFEQANKIRESSTVSICEKCSKKSTHHVLVDFSGNIIKNGAQVNIGKTYYHVTCRRCKNEWLNNYEKEKKV